MNNEKNAGRPHATMPISEDSGLPLYRAAGELRKLAEAATPGPWHWGGTPVAGGDEALEICRANINATAQPGLHFCEVFLDDGRRTALVGNGPTSIQNAAWIAAANPAEILRLLDALAATPAQPIAPAADVSAPTDEPTAEMIAAGGKCTYYIHSDSCDDGWDEEVGDKLAAKIYAAMRAAAPVSGPSDPDLTGLERFDVDTEYGERDIRPYHLGEYVKLADVQALIDSRPRSEDSRAKVLQECADLIATVSCQMPNGWDSVYRSVFNQGADNLRMAGAAAIRALASSAAPTGASAAPSSGESADTAAHSSAPSEATRLVCLEAAQKLRTYVGIYTGDKQARRLVDELSNIAAALAAPTGESLPVQGVPEVREFAACQYCDKQMLDGTECWNVNASRQCAYRQAAQTGESK